MKKKRNVVLIILGSVLGLCILCTIVIAVTPKSHSTPTAALALGEVAEKQAEGNGTSNPAEITSPTNRLFTSTSQATSTPQPTETSTAVPVPPATQTREAVLAKQTQVAQGATATRQAIYEIQTATSVAQNATKTQAAMSKTETVEVLNTNRTSTAEVKAAQATKIAEYQTIPWKELITYPEKYTGQKVKVSGQIFNINGDTELQMWIGNMEAIYVVMAEPFSGIYQDSWIIVYGTVQGQNCGTNAFGGQVCQPLLNDAFYTIP
jgi:uncharacterized secreted protein with C-terminal beta-propeller domain